MVDWDKFAGDYDSVFLESPLYRDTIERMTALVQDGDKKSILDLGCGTGTISEVLLTKFPGARILGVDPSAGMRDVYAERFNNEEGVSVDEGNSLAVPSVDDYFDCVLSNLALHHVLPEQRDDCAAELARVLKPGGAFIYADLFCDVDGPPGDVQRSRDLIEKGVSHALYCLEHGAYQLMILLLRALPWNLENDGEYITTTEVWIQALRRAGFIDIEVTHVPPEEVGTRIIHARLEL
jgi:ubiquinone/menaquinone biosynthesis C-methylase UbiE